MNILIVDDNQDAAESLADILEYHGHETEICGDGKQGLAAYQQTQHHLVLMDLKMPVMNGGEAAVEILKFHPDARVVIVTGNTMEADLEQIQELGVVKLLRKPYDPQEILELLK